MMQHGQPLIKKLLPVRMGHLQASRIIQGVLYNFVT